MTFTAIYVYNRKLNQYMYMGLPGIIHPEMDRLKQIESMRRLVDRETADLLEKYDFVVDGLKKPAEIPNWMRFTAEELRTFMESYPVNLRIPLPEDFRVRDLAKISDIFGEYDDEGEGFSWNRDEVCITDVASDMAEHIREDVNMLYPDLEVIVTGADDGDIYDEGHPENGE